VGHGRFFPRLIDNLYTEASSETNVDTIGGRGANKKCGSAFRRRFPAQENAMRLNYSASQQTGYIGIFCFFGAIGKFRCCRMRIAAQRRVYLGKPGTVKPLK
jgi:hypothetical protein